MIEISRGTEGVEKGRSIRGCNDKAELGVLSSPMSVCSTVRSAPEEEEEEEANDG